MLIFFLITYNYRKPNVLRSIIKLTIGGLETIWTIPLINRNNWSFDLVTQNVSLLTFKYSAILSLTCVFGWFVDLVCPPILNDVLLNPSADIKF